MKIAILPHVLSVLVDSLWIIIPVVIFVGIVSFVWGREKEVALWTKNNLFFWKKGECLKFISSHIKRINALHNQPGLYNEILRSICDAAGACDASLLTGSDPNSFSVKAYVGSTPMSFVVEELEVFLKWLSRQSGMITKESFSKNDNQGGMYNICVNYFLQFHTELCVPLFLNNNLIGVVNLGQRRFGKYDKNACELVTLLCDYCVSVLQSGNILDQMRYRDFKMREVDLLRNQMISNMSHEFRTPLHSIIGLTELIAEGGDGEVNEDQIKHLTMVSQAGKRLLEIICSMLDLAKLQANKLTLHVKKINVSKMVCDVTQTFKPNPFTKLIVDLGDIPGVYGDEERVQQIFKHLLSNAMKYTKSGKIMISAEKTGEMLKFCISDTGVGIDPEYQKLIFEGFRQIDGGLDREHEGLGLGLALSKKIVELHGGRIWLSSKKGKGSSFYFTLPVRPIGIKPPELVQ